MLVSSAFICYTLKVMKQYIIEFYDHADQKGLSFGMEGPLEEVKEQVGKFIRQATDYAYAMIVSPKGYNVHIVKP